MSSFLELNAAKASINLSGLLGAKAVHPLDVDKIVTSVNMKVGAYTIAAQPTAPCRLTVSHTAVGAADTLGTIVFVGTLPDGTAIQETVTPVAGETVSTVNEFVSVTSATGVGWVIGEGNDTITIGVGAVIPDSFYFEAIGNRIVASTNMKVGAYTVAAQPFTPCKLQVTTAAGDTADTMGTVTIFGKDTDNNPITEVVTPVSGQTVETEKIYSHVYSVIGAGWVIDEEEETNDTIIVGTAEVSVPTDYYFSTLQIIADAVVSAQENVTGHTNPALSTFTSLAAGTVICGKFSSITLTSGQVIAYKAQL